MGESKEILEETKKNEETKINNEKIIKDDKSDIVDSKKLKNNEIEHSEKKNKEVEKKIDPKIKKNKQSEMLKTSSNTKAETKDKVNNITQTKEEFKSNVDIVTSSDQNKNNKKYISPKKSQPQSEKKNTINTPNKLNPYQTDKILKTIPKIGMRSYLPTLDESYRTIEAKQFYAESNSKSRDSSSNKSEHRSFCDAKFV